MNRPIARSKLNHVFRHAADFGITGNWNSANAALFEQALDDHVNNPAVVAITGRFRGVQAVTHFYDPSTQLNVMIDAVGDLVSAWRLDPRQVKWLLTPPNHNIQ